MTTAKPLLEMTAVDLVRSTKQLLQSISLRVEAGEILTIIGPNGAGKTTLLRIALGLIPPSAGKVERRANLCIGYMPQKLHIDPSFPLTVQRFLAMAGKDHRKDILPLLQEVGAARVLDSRLQTLSGGELQRVLLARALIREPELLVLDEPVQGVDVQGQMELYQLISQIRTQRGCAVMMVSHDLHLVMAATDRVLCLNRHICCSGTPEVVTNHPAYLEMFGPQAFQQLAVYTHDPEHHQHHHNCVNCREKHNVR